MLRKPTSFFHYLGGLIIACLFWQGDILYAVSLLVSFGVFEFWQEHKIKDTGALDFLDLLQALFVGGGILVILRLCNIL